jgi:hypothetical protein
MANKCEYCGKETQKRRFCCNTHRNQAWREKYRQKRREQHLCIDCGVKLEPILIYHARCPKHLKLNENKKQKSYRIELAGEKLT